MNTLDSHLDDLAVDYLSFSFLTAVNSVWTWVAVITAAVSFWRIKAAGAGTLKFLPRGQNPDGPLLPEPSSLDENSVNAEPGSTSASSMAPSVKAVETTEGTTRGKFTVYYKDEGEGEGESAAAGEVDDGGVEGLGEEGSGGEERWCGSWEWDWETTLRMRMGDGDMGWYGNQDLTVLDGNVVRLWDGCRQRSKVSISFSSTVAGGVMW